MCRRNNPEHNYRCVVITLSVVAGFLCLAVGIIVPMSTSAAWIQYEVPDEISGKIPTKLADLHQKYPQMFYTRQVYLNEFWTMCFPDMNNNIWSSAFGLPPHPMTCYKSESDAVDCKQEPFCLSRDEAERSWHTLSNSTTLQPDSDVSKFTDKRAAAVHTGRALIITVSVLSWFFMCIPCMFYEDERRRCSIHLAISTLALMTLASFLIPVVVLVKQLYDEEEQLTEPPFYGFIKRHEILSATKRKTEVGFILAISSLAILLFGVLLLLIAFLIQCRCSLNPLIRSCRRCRDSIAKRLEAAKNRRRQQQLEQQQAKVNVYHLPVPMKPADKPIKPHLSVPDPS